jgi:cytidyltransferase-like protein
MKIGLTIGKFAPLHKGHQWMIETALEEVDQLIVIVYDAPEAKEMPMDMRIKWLTQLYPMVKIIKGEDPPRDKGYTEAIQKKHEDYILSLLGKIKIHAFYSSEYYGERMSAALNCEHRMLDKYRTKIPISGTLIRKSLESYKHFLDLIVLNDLQK